MLNTNNNAIKNSNGVTKKFFNLIFISFLFLGLLTLFSIQTAKAFQTDDVVSLSIEAGGGLCYIGNSSANINYGGYYALLEKKIDRSTFAGSPPYCLKIIKTTITGPGTCKVPGCCKILGCGSDLSLECVDIKYLSSREYTGGLYEGIYTRRISEYCKKCHVEVVEVTEISGDRTTVKDILVAKNRCAKYKAGACDTPCPDSLTCPVIERDCVIENRNGDDDAEDENDYRCVDKVATAAAPAAGAPIARETPAAAPITGGGAVLGVSTAVTDPACCDEVANNSFTWCPPNQKGGCCKPGLKCCSAEPDKWPDWATCCKPEQTCAYSRTSGDACNNSVCPDPKYPQKCPGRKYTACCEPSPKNECGYFASSGLGYCQTCSDPTKPVRCEAGVCCNANQSCASFAGIVYCSASTCEAGKEELCKSIGNAEITGYNKCCKIGECRHDPKGLPNCLSD